MPDLKSEPAIFIRRPVSLWPAARLELKFVDVQPEVIASLFEVLQDRTTGLLGYLILANQPHRLINEPDGVARLDSTGIRGVT